MLIMSQVSWHGGFDTRESVASVMLWEGLWQDRTHRRWELPLADGQSPQSYNHKELNSANNLSECGSRLRTPEPQVRMQSLTSWVRLWAENPAKPHGTSALQNLWGNKWMLGHQVCGNLLLRKRTLTRLLPIPSKPYWLFCCANTSGQLLLLWLGIQCSFAWNGLLIYTWRGFPGGASGKESTCQCRRPKKWGFETWVGKIPWRRT